jgi:DNA anti-recombination protein RmuC
MASNRDNQTASLEKVRDILFGEQARSQEKTLSQMERRLRRQVQEIAAELSKRLGSFERATQKELAALNERIEAEENDAAAFQGEVSARIEEVSKTLERRIAQLAQQQTKELNLLRQETQKQVKALGAEAAKGREELEGELLAELDDVRSSHIDRGQLGALLADMAVRISGKRASKG